MARLFRFAVPRSAGHPSAGWVKGVSSAAVDVTQEAARRPETEQRGEVDGGRDPQHSAEQLREELETAELNEASLVRHLGRVHDDHGLELLRQVRDRIDALRRDLDEIGSGD